MEFGSESRDVRDPAGPAGLSRRQLIGGGLSGLAILAVGPAVAGCGSGSDDPSAASDGKARLVEFLSTPGPSFTDGPGAVAAALGFFKDEGLDLTVQYPGSSIRGIQTLVGGKDAIVSADSFATMVATSEGFEVRSLFLSFRGYGFGFAVADGSPIEEWDEDTVAGTRIGITEFAGGEVPLLRGALARLGIAEGGDGGVELVPIGVEAPEAAEAVRSDTVDIVAASVFDFELLRAAGVELRNITPDYIRQFPGHGYVTTPELLDENRDLLTGFLRARAKGTVYCSANTLSAAEMAIAAAPASAEGLNTEAVATFLERILVDGNREAFDPDHPDFHRLGLQSEATWDDYQQFLIATETQGDDGVVLTSEIDPSSVIDNSLIDAVNDFDYAEIEALAKAAT